MNSSSAQRAWSCDTFYAAPDATRTGLAIFGKNSDRPAGEAQPLRWNPGRAGDGRLDLSYVSIDDAPAFAHLGSAPHWCWGYEYAVNVHGVAIGNEAIFTRAWAAHVADDRAGRSPKPGIIGMELLRLGVERSATAREALTVITELLASHGQWGSGMAATPRAEGSYDNAFVIVDPTEGYVLETFGREWVARRLHSGTFSISNEPTIRQDFDFHSAGLRAALLGPDRRAETTVDFAEAAIDPGTPLQVSHIRQRRSAQILSDARTHGGVEVADAKTVLRDHYEGTFLEGPYLNAARPDFLTLCMHEHPSEFTWGNTASSVVIELARTPSELTVVWWTPLPPCIGAYVPIFLESESLPLDVTIPGPVVPNHPEDMSTVSFEARSYWWRMQNLLDVVKGDELGATFDRHSASARTHFDNLEHQWTESVSSFRSRWATASVDDRRALVPELTALTSSAIEAVDAYIANTIARHAPDLVDSAFDSRWRPK